MAWVERQVSNPGDEEEARHRKAQLVIASALIVPAGILWGVLYAAFSERTAALLPWCYALITLANLLVLLRVRRYDVFRRVQQFFLVALPFGLQLALGGFVGSSLAIVWSFLAVLMGLLFGSVREAVWWFALFMLSIVAAAWIQPSLAVTNQLPHVVVLVLFVLNLGAVATLAFVVLHSFVTDRRKLRQLEVAYLSQELTLRQTEKLATLGTLAAGVAHELNNPASAAARAVEQLAASLSSSEDARRRLDGLELTPVERGAMYALMQVAIERSQRMDDVDPVIRGDGEAAVEDWLDRHGVADPWEIAPALFSQGLDAAALGRQAATFHPEALECVLRWLASAYITHGLLSEIGRCGTRVSGIVGALKGYTHLGESPLLSVDIHQGIEDTLVILHHTIGDGVSVRREYANDLPPLLAFGNELNQVWTNVLKNAIDAVGSNGVITIRTQRTGDWVTVEIEDTGPGIPDQIQPRIFDPFFTTKEPGRGVGLGLSISHSIVTRKHRGELGVTSKPGSTRFTVRLPVALGAGPVGPATAASAG